MRPANGAKLLRPHRRCVPAAAPSGNAAPLKPAQTSPYARRRQVAFFHSCAHTVTSWSLPRSSTSDNTLVKGSSLFLVGRGMLHDGVITRRDVARFAGVQARFRLRGEHLGQLQGANDRALILGVGLAVAEVVALGEQIYRERVVARLWPQTVALARTHLAAGHEVWLVSAAPIELVQIADAWN